MSRNNRYSPVDRVYGSAGRQDQVNNNSTDHRYTSSRLHGSGTGLSRSNSDASTTGERPSRRSPLDGAIRDSYRYRSSTGTTSPSARAVQHDASVPSTSSLSFTSSPAFSRTSTQNRVPDVTQPNSGSSLRTTVPQYNYSAIPDEELLRMLANHESKRKRHQSKTLDNCTYNPNATDDKSSSVTNVVHRRQGSSDDTNSRIASSSASPEGSASSSAALRRRRLQMTRSLTLPEEDPVFSQHRLSLITKLSVDDKQIEAHSPKIAQTFHPFKDKTTLDDDTEKVEITNPKEEAEKRAERIAKYKEERRKELSSIIATKTGSSSLKRSTTIDLPGEDSSKPVDYYTKYRSHGTQPPSQKQESEDLKTISNAQSLKDSDRGKVSSPTKKTWHSASKSDVPYLTQSNLNKDGGLSALSTTITAYGENPLYKAPEKTASKHESKSKSSTITAYGENPLYKAPGNTASKHESKSKSSTITAYGENPLYEAPKKTASKHENKSKSSVNLSSNSKSDSKQTDKSKYTGFDPAELISKIDALKRKEEEELRSLPSSKIHTKPQTGVSVDDIGQSKVTVRNNHVKTPGSSVTQQKTKVDPFTFEMPVDSKVTTPSLNDNPTDPAKQSISPVKKDRVSPVAPPISYQQQSVPLSFAKPQVCLGDVSNRKARLGTQKRVEDDLDLMIEEMLEHRPGISPQAEPEDPISVTTAIDVTSTTPKSVVTNTSPNRIPNTSHNTQVKTTTCVSAQTTKSPASANVSQTVSKPVFNFESPVKNKTKNDAIVNPLRQQTTQQQPLVKADSVDITLKVTEESTDSDRPMFDALKIISRQSRIRKRNDSSSSSDSFSPSPSRRLSPRAARRIKRMQQSRDSESSTSTLGQEFRSSRPSTKQKSKNRGLDTPQGSVEDEIVAITVSQDLVAPRSPGGAPRDESSGWSSPVSPSRPSSREGGKRRFRSRDLDAPQPGELPPPLSVTDVAHLAVPGMMPPPSARKSRKKDKSSARKSGLNRLEEETKQAAAEFEALQAAYLDDGPFDRSHGDEKEITQREKHIASLYADSPKSDAAVSIKMSSANDDLDVTDGVKKGGGIVRRSEVLKFHVPSSTSKETPSSASTSTVQNDKQPSVRSRSDASSQPHKQQAISVASSSTTGRVATLAAATEGRISSVCEDEAVIVGEAAAAEAGGKEGVPRGGVHVSAATASSRQRTGVTGTGRDDKLPAAVETRKDSRVTKLSSSTTTSSSSSSLPSQSSGATRTSLTTNKLSKAARESPSVSAIPGKPEEKSKQQQQQQQQSYDDKRRHKSTSNQSSAGSEAVKTETAEAAFVITEQRPPHPTTSQQSSASSTHKILTQDHENAINLAHSPSMKAVTSTKPGVTQSAKSSSQDKIKDEGNNDARGRTPNGGSDLLTLVPAPGGDAPITSSLDERVTKVTSPTMETVGDDVNGVKDNGVYEDGSTPAHVPVICGQNRRANDNNEERKTPTRKVLTGSKDFSKLVRRFSGSEGSNSDSLTREKSPTPPKKFVIRKPEIPAALRPEENAVTLRKTPERTQSLREGRNKTPTRDSIPRRSSFNQTGEVVRRRYQGAVAQPDEELAKILHRRSRNLEEYEEALASNKIPSAEILVNKLESKIKKRPSATADDISGVVDQEMLSVLMSRRAKTDSDSASEEPTNDVSNVESSQDGQKISPILKQKTESDQRVIPILKKKDSITESLEEETESPVMSILKHKAVLEESSKTPASDVDIKPILKANTDQDSSTDIPSILRRKSSADESDIQALKRSPILKRDSSEEAETSPKYKTHSILTRRDSDKQTIANAEADSKPSSILKKADDSREEQSNSTRLGRRKSSDGEVKLKSVLRQPSLKQANENKSSGLDPELAFLLQVRRNLSIEEGEEPVAIATDIHSSNIISSDQSEESSETQVSVAERIFQMQNKIEGDTPPSSKSGSGSVTPSHALGFRSGSPSADRLSESMLAPLSIPTAKSVISDKQLLEKLNDAASMKRRRFQARDRSDWRVKTQPITHQEISMADELDRISSFRAEINKRACLNILSDFHTPKSPPRAQVIKGKKRYVQESYPEHYRRTEKSARRNGARYKTQPVTLSELSEVSETEPITVENGSKDGKKNGSGGESDIDLDKLVQSNMEEARKLARQRREGPQSWAMGKSKYKPKGLGIRRFQDRKKKTERSFTQPITEEEVKEAADIGDNEKEAGAKATKPKSAVVTSKDGSGSDSGEEPSMLSLSEKMKLFSQQANQSQILKPAVQPIVKKNRRQQSRFKTQPVTPEEVEKAGHISPLAASLIKPPDPELIQDLSIKEQQSAMAEYAEKTLAASKSRSTTKASASGRRGSDGDVKMKGILRQADSTQEQLPSILKASPDVDHSIQQSILKSESSTQPISSQLTSQDVTMTSTSQQQRSILKHIDSKKSVETKKSILKKDSSSERSLEKEGSQAALKKDSWTDKKETRSILKDGASGEEDSKGENQQDVDSDQRTVSGDRLTNEDAAINNTVTESSPTENSPERGCTKVITNEAVAARKKRTEMRKSGERFHTQPIQVEEKSSTIKTAERNVTSSSSSKRITERHLTQPITRIEREKAEDEDTMNRGSIADRVAALKKDGEESWRRRSPFRENFRSNIIKSDEESPVTTKSRPSSIVDRLSKLEESKTGWRSRVNETDAKQFTVEGKMAKDGKSKLKLESPLSSRKKVSPRKDRLKIGSDLDSSESSMSTPPQSPTKPQIRIPTALLKQTNSPAPSSDEKVNSSSDDDRQAAIRVEVPKADDESFSSFFKTKSTVTVQKKTEVSIDDFNHIFMESTEILQTTKRVRPIRKTTGSRNPLRKLAMRDDIQQQYEEVQAGIGERELKRLKRDQIAGSASLAESALAGLASTENFSKVTLKKADSFTAASFNKHEPFKSTMLIQVKGRRHVQARLVEPKAKSINSGDCFVLVVKDRVFCWTGEYANVIEKAKASELALTILQKKDLGCKSQMPDVQNVVETKAQTSTAQAFWEVLGGQAPYQEVGPPEEDECYEVNTVATNMVYKVKGEELIAYEEFWGAIPKHSMLNPNEILVFDFGSELYVWNGKKVPFNKRKCAIKLANKLWDQGYDYSECDINPLYPVLLEEDAGADDVPMKAGSRPPWALFGKIVQDMETCLFKEKFMDWPDSAHIIKVKGGKNEANSKCGGDMDLQPCDVAPMLAEDKQPLKLILDGSNVDRGTKWSEEYEGLHREYEILTLGVVVWHVLEGTISKLSKASHGQFHEGDTYVVRWQYMITQSGLKTLKGTPSARHSLTGRERCAYFFWQGKESSITEKGASALMTVELDEERGPQVRVVQGKEAPAFLNLFKGGMIVHIGKREEEDTNTQGPWRLYVVRSEIQTETFLQEVECEPQSLRSQASFLLLNVYTGLLYVWHGAKSSKQVRVNALTIARALKKCCPAEVGLHKKASVLVMEMDEGSEKQDFSKALGLNDDTRFDYHSLLKSTRTFSHTARLFHMTSISGTFIATEIHNVMRHPNMMTVFPFLQSDLYRASQPAIFLLDNTEEVYLWEGWWPEGDEEIENVNTGSAHARFTVERKCAMETTLRYCQEKKGGATAPAYLIHAGVEPLKFTNLFPYWEPDDTVTEIAQKSGKRLHRTLVKDALKQLSRTRFTFEELTADSPPEGVDPLKLESYLDDAEFESLLGMNKTEFYALPAWKQANLKKNASLF